MKFEYAFEGMKLKVLDETFAGKVLEFYSRNREEFDRYEAAKPDNFYTTAVSYTHLTLPTTERV